MITSSNLESFLYHYKFTWLFVLEPDIAIYANLQYGGSRGAGGDKNMGQGSLSQLIFSTKYN